jgi:hypothetical protein
MPISVQCAQCGKNLRVPDSYGGKRGKCLCGAILNIPAAGGFQAAPPPPSPEGFAAPPDQGKQAFADGVAGSGPRPGTFRWLWRLFLLSLVMSFVVLAATGLLVGVLGDKLDMDESTLTLIGLSGGGLFFFLYFIAILTPLVFLYKAWALIQDGQPRTSPGKAVGFLLIPIFNIYWQFVVSWGLAKDLNGYAQERSLQAREASAGMLLWGLILNFIGCAPIGLILLFLGWNSVKNACIDIATAKIG